MERQVVVPCLARLVLTVSMLGGDSALAAERKPLPTAHSTRNLELDLNYGDLRAMQYHPDAAWWKERGYSDQLAKCVPIPEVIDFLDPQGIHSQPWVVLHVLAHGFHDQMIGFDEPRVVAAWKKFCDSGKYQSVLTIRLLIFMEKGTKRCVRMR